MITLNGQSSVTIPLATNYVDPGATAYDNGDDNISDRIQIVNPVNTNLPDTYTITYNVTDSAGLAADQVTRTVIVVDTTPPVITLNGMSSVTIEKGTTYVDPGATAYDNGDDNISDRIQTVNPVNTNLPDTYTITYNVTDSAGLAADQVTRTVTVIVNDPLVGTFYLEAWDKYLGAAHQLSSRPGSLSWNNGAWQQLSVVKKSDGYYTLMSYQGSGENRQEYYLSDNNNNINFNTQNINESTSLLVSKHSGTKYTFERISDGKYITINQRRDAVNYEEKYSFSYDYTNNQQWVFTRV